VPRSLADGTYDGCVYRFVSLCIIFKFKSAVVTNYCGAFCNLNMARILNWLIAALNGRRDEVVFAPVVA